jgi:hypothetical protein
MACESGKCRWAQTLALEAIAGIFVVAVSYPAGLWSVERSGFLVHRSIAPALGGHVSVFAVAVPAATSGMTCFWGKPLQNSCCCAL